MTAAAQAVLGTLAISMAKDGARTADGKMEHTLIIAPGAAMQMQAARFARAEHATYLIKSCVRRKNGQQQITARTAANSTLYANQKPAQRRLATLKAKQFALIIYGKKMAIALHAAAWIQSASSYAQIMNAT